MKQLIKYLLSKYLTILRGKPQTSQTREMAASPIRDTACPYCFSNNVVKRGLRHKKHESVQLYLCQSCHKTFTPQITKGKHYPLPVIFEAVSIYNLGYSLEQTCRIVNSRHQKTASSEAVSLGKEIESPRPDNQSHSITPMKYLSSIWRRAGDSHSSPALTGPQGLSSLAPTKGVYPPPLPAYQISLQPSTLSYWLTEFKDYLPYLRLREFAVKRYPPQDTVIHATLAHQQLFRYRFHAAKCHLMVREDIQHRKFQPLQEYLELVPAECPHQYFSQGLRASEVPLTFSKTQMIVRSKQNYATKLCAFVLQSVQDNKLRHEALQKFMLANDSVTVATEVPVYLTRDDLEHMQTQLGFEMYQKTQNTRKAGKSEKSDNQTIRYSDALDLRDSDTLSLPSFPKLITGHIDLLQIRNGQAHLLDYKPKAAKQRPIEQLTLYAMALSRLTGLRLFEFKCAWFDEHDYFEFFPLHVLHKPRKTSRRRKIATKEGIYQVNQDKRRITSLKPIIQKLTNYVIH